MGVGKGPSAGVVAWVVGIGEIVIESSYILQGPVTIACYTRTQ